MSTGPASARCQRWNRGTVRWRHVHEVRFDAAAFAVHPVPERIARWFVTAHHYAGTYPAARMAFALTTDDPRWGTGSGAPAIQGCPVVGVAVLSVPMRRSVLTNVFPDLEPYAQTLELGRFVLTDTPGNAESWFLGQVWSLAAAAGIRGVVSFADPMPRSRTVVDVDSTGRRRSRRELVTPGHVGIIYQATNATACGRSTPRTVNYLPARGVVLPERALSKIRTQDTGSIAAERSLVALGADPRPPSMPPAVWLRDALEQLGVVKVRHPGNYRYAWSLGSRTDRRSARIALPATAYPKPSTGRLPVL